MNNTSLLATRRNAHRTMVTCTSAVSALLDMEAAIRLLRKGAVEGTVYAAEIDETLDAMMRRRDELERTIEDQKRILRAIPA